MACYLYGKSAQLCPISDDCHMLQMEPLGDRILIKPDEEKNVSINLSPANKTFSLAGPATSRRLQTTKFLRACTEPFLGLGAHLSSANCGTS